MVEITQPKQYVSGANQTIVVEIYRGERRRQRIRIRNNNNPVNLTGATLSANVVYCRGDVTIQANKRATFANFGLATNPSIDNRTFTITPDTDRTQGMATLIIPEDIATVSQTASVGATVGILCPVVYISYNLGDDKDILTHTLIVIVRYAP